MARSRSSVPMNILASFPKNESCDNAKSFMSVGLPSLLFLQNAILIWCSFDAPWWKLPRLNACKIAVTWRVEFLNI